MRSGRGPQLLKITRYRKRVPQIFFYHLNLVRSGGEGLFEDETTVLYWDLVCGHYVLRIGGPSSCHHKTIGTMTLDKNTLTVVANSIYPPPTNCVQLKRCVIAWEYLLPNRSAVDASLNDQTMLFATQR
jgi:hypothetical protein